jgi:hypothetical protein
MYTLCRRRLCPSLHRAARIREAAELKDAQIALTLECDYPIRFVLCTEGAGARFLLRVRPHNVDETRERLKGHRFLAAATAFNFPVTVLATADL